MQCFDCKPGQFYWQGTCKTKCDDIHVNGSPAVVTVFGILAVMLVWIILNKSAGGAYECLDVGLSYIQIMSTVFTFDSLYLDHSTSYNTIVLISNLINLNVDYVSPSCLWPGGIWKCVPVRPLLDTAIAIVLRPMPP